MAWDGIHDRQMLKELLAEWKKTNQILEGIKTDLDAIVVNTTPPPPIAVSGELILGKPVSQ